MERESFEDEEVAKVLNDKYISIKVDREERPDIDQIYMSFCQATTGSGGWPLSVFITADKKPFYVGTYFPKESKYGVTGFMNILEAIHQKWQGEREEIEDSAEKLTDMINQMTESEEAQVVDDQIFERTYNYFKSSFDAKYGGFGNEPKFPTPHNLLFLLRYYHMNHSQDALKMVEKTLIQIYKGGIFDHVGFGFSRYSTDRRWLVPHFEKMLYDNALLLMAYVETYQVTKKPIYKEIAEKIIAYVMREMTSQEGGFFCAEDADSEGVEGKFYVWTKEEVYELLGDEEGALYCKYYDITKKGNFEEKSIPNFIHTDLEEINSDPVLKEKLKKLSEKLFMVREERVHPHKDDKILTSWNGLMIAGIAMAGRAFGNLDYLDGAERAVQFIENNLFRSDSRLLSRYRDGDAVNLAFLEDYAFLIWAYIELYEGVFKTEYLKSAIRLTDDVIRYFQDEQVGGFFLYGSDSEQLIARPKEIYDGALPSGNSVVAYTLLKLSKLTGNEAYERTAKRLFEHFGSKLNEAPFAYSMMLCAYIFGANPTKEIVLAGRSEDQVIKEMLRKINQSYLPFTVILLNDEQSNLGEINSFANNQVAIDGKPTAYVCENFMCQRPVFNLDALNDLIKQ